jgi:hydroxypyruvate isomerase
MRFSVNVSLLYTEHPFLERFAHVARAGFQGVEFWWPPPEALPGLVAAVEDADLEVALFNFYAGDMPAGDRGLLSDPGREGEFREQVPRALELAEQLNCKRLNALVGLRVAGEDAAAQLERARSNVAWAAEQAEAIGATVLIEALNTIDNGPYLISSTAAAAAFADSVGRPNVELQYDVFQMQRMEGNLTETLTEHMHRIGHIQIGDLPGRHEPGTGEINFDHVLGAIDAAGYGGWVGLEYRPSGESTDDSFAWLPPERRGVSTAGTRS